MLKNLWRRAFLKRIPILDDARHHATEKYSLFDLLCVGIGATVGSGVFVVTGQVAHEIAGPS
ncbi:amino acid permease, partial [archaeon]